MFYAVRAFIGSALLMICALIIRKKRVFVNKRRWFVFSVITVLLLSTFLCFVPIENLFITFPTLEASYRYSNPNHIDLIVDGNESAFVAGSRNNIDNYFIVPKSDGGWKVGVGKDTKMILKKLTDDTVVYLYQYKDSAEYYIAVFNVNRDPLKISDSKNSKFEHTEKYVDAVSKNYYTYFSYIGGFDCNYTLTVNGKAIKLIDEKLIKN